MAKLFDVTYVDGRDSVNYLTLGTNEDTDETVRERELDRVLEDGSCIIFFAATEVKEVEGHTIIVGEKI